MGANSRRKIFRRERGKEREGEGEREGREEDFPPPVSSCDGSNFRREETRGEGRCHGEREREEEKEEGMGEMEERKRRNGGRGRRYRRRKFSLRFPGDGSNFRCQETRHEEREGEERGKKIRREKEWNHEKGEE